MATDKRKPGPVHNSPIISFAFDFHSYFMLCKKGGSGNRMPKIEHLPL
jgi:hypothetical protein